MTQNEFRRRRNVLRRQVRSARLDANRLGAPLTPVHKPTDFGPGHIIGWVYPGGVFRTASEAISTSILFHSPRPSSKDGRFHYARALRQAREIDSEMGKGRIP
jgi:hypothetical protein